MDVFSSLECTGMGLLTKKRAFSLKKRPWEPLQSQAQGRQCPNPLSLFTLDVIWKSWGFFHCVKHSQNQRFCSREGLNEDMCHPMEKNRVNWEHSSPPSTCQCPPSQPSPSMVPLETPWKRLKPEGLTISTLQELLFYSAKKMFPIFFFPWQVFFSLSGFPDSDMREVKIPSEGETNP